MVCHLEKQHRLRMKMLRKIFGYRNNTDKTIREYKNSGWKTS
jgi:hypothetical protein